MSPLEFINFAFDSLASVNSIITDEYFTDDPSGVIYCKISLREVAAETLEMDLAITWDTQNNCVYNATGPADWQHLVADFLLTSGRKG